MNPLKFMELDCRPVTSSTLKIYGAILAGLRERIGGEIFQIAANNEVTVSELIGLMVKALLSRKINFQKIEHTDVRTGDIYRNYSDISNAQNLLEWSPSVNLEDGLAMTVDYFLQHKEGFHH